jgi:hypothetical protein
MDRLWSDAARVEWTVERSDAYLYSVMIVERLGEYLCIVGAPGELEGGQFPYVLLERQPLREESF